MIEIIKFVVCSFVCAISPHKNGCVCVTHTHTRNHQSANAEARAPLSQNVYDCFHSKQKHFNMNWVFDSVGFVTVCVSMFVGFVCLGMLLLRLISVWFV